MAHGTSIGIFGTNGELQEHWAGWHSGHLESDLFEGELKESPSQSLDFKQPKPFSDNVAKK